VKGGFEWARHEDNRNLNFIPDAFPAQWTSIDPANLATGVTAAGIGGAGWSTRQFNVNTASDFAGFISAINASPNRAQFYALYDTNGNGAITQAELGSSLVFNSTAGNPNSAINYYRSIQSAAGAQSTRVRGWTYFGQDEFSYSRFTFNVGLRAEQWGHFATTGENIYQYPWNFAPRLSATMDLRGDGKQKASAYYGRYYDPIRMDQTNFAGTLTGQVREEQVFANNQWITYRIRGGPVQQDGFFSNTAKTPYTDELQFQYEVDLGKNMSGSATYYHRQTRDIYEDFDPALYTVPEAYGTAFGAGNVNDPNTLFLGWDYFGFDANNPPVANFFLGTLNGGERNYNGLELAFRKRFSDRWQGLASYNYLDAKGNAVSDGNADFAGDVLWLDPRAPNTYGVVPGTIHNIVKFAGSYTTPIGVEVGGTYRWNSGTVVNRTQLSSSRRLPVQITPAQAFAFGGVTEQWVAPDAIGAVQNPAWGQFDARVQYVKRFDRFTAEFFADIFNVFNDQAPTRLEDLAAGTGTTQFGGEIQWLSPRRAFLGARLGF